MPLRPPHVEVAEGLELFSKNKGWASLLSAFALLCPPSRSWRTLKTGVTTGSYWAVVAAVCHWGSGWGWEVVGSKAARKEDGKTEHKCSNKQRRVCTSHLTHK